MALQPIQQHQRKNIEITPKYSLYKLMLCSNKQINLTVRLSIALS